jgi:hypothetical protein
MFKFILSATPGHYGTRNPSIHVPRFADLQNLRDFGRLPLDTRPSMIICNPWGLLTHRLSHDTVTESSHNVS